MVVGGNVDFEVNRAGLTNRIELLTPNATFANKCRKNVEALFGDKFDYETSYYDYESKDYVDATWKVQEFDATSMTGLFVKDAPIGRHTYHKSCL